MKSQLASIFSRKVDCELITYPTYQVVDWLTEAHITNLAVNLTLGIDGYQQLADDAALGRQVARWRSRNRDLADLLDQEAALDALADDSRR